MPRSANLLQLRNWKRISTTVTCFCSMAPSNGDSGQAKTRCKKTTTVEKKAHTLKEVVISKATKWIGFISSCFAGKQHDYSLLKTVLPTDKEWFKKFTVRLDLGFLGFVKDYVCAKVFIAFKKPRGQELSPEQRAVNKEQAKQRVCVEHSIGGLKRYRILSDGIRMHHHQLYDDVLEVCAGL